MKRDYPSIRPIIFFGLPCSLSFETKEKISVQERTLPRSRDPVHVKYSVFKTTFMKNMISMALTKADGTPRMIVWADCFLNRCHSVLKALAKIIGGRKIARILCGFISLTILIDEPRKSGN